MEKIQPHPILKKLINGLIHELDDDSIIKNYPKDSVSERFIANTDILEYAIIETIGLQTKERHFTHAVATFPEARRIWNIKTGKAVDSNEEVFLFIGTPKAVDLTFEKFQRAFKNYSEKNNLKEKIELNLLAISDKATILALSLKDIEKMAPHIVQSMLKEAPKWFFEIFSKNTYFHYINNIIKIKPFHKLNYYNIVKLNFRDEAGKQIKLNTIYASNNTTLLPNAIIRGNTEDFNKPIQERCQYIGYLGEHDPELNRMSYYKSNERAITGQTITYTKHNTPIYMYSTTDNFIFFMHNNIMEGKENILWRKANKKDEPRRWSNQRIFLKDKMPILKMMMQNILITISNADINKTELDTRFKFLDEAFGEIPIFGYFYKNTMGIKKASTFLQEAYDSSCNFKNIESQLSKKNVINLLLGILLFRWSQHKHLRSFSKKLEKESTNLLTNFILNAKDLALVHPSICEYVGNIFYSGCKVEQNKLKKKEKKILAFLCYENITLDVSKKDKSEKENEEEKTEDAHHQNDKSFFSKNLKEIIGFDIKSDLTFKDQIQRFKENSKIQIKNLKNQHKPLNDDYSHVDLINIKMALTITLEAEINDNDLLDQKDITISSITSYIIQCLSENMTYDKFKMKVFKKLYDLEKGRLGGGLKVAMETMKHNELVPQIFKHADFMNPNRTLNTREGKIKNNATMKCLKKMGYWAFDFTKLKNFADKINADITNLCLGKDGKLRFSLKSKSPKKMQKYLNKRSKRPGDVLNINLDNHSIVLSYETSKNFNTHYIKDDPKNMKKKNSKQEPSKKEKINFSPFYVSGGLSFFPK